ncbi:S8 family serine peptidase [Streptomyces sp. AC627_RSS907]|uniref:S8 family serine peptidase n=1 Tax=Streptomyces sp. AC627_RSS907 TaxID=2823684 RepID=UPI001C240705|nr:S8 family serine peptidase [Streptomyces sp. AC627_RSS907]
MVAPAVALSTVLAPSAGARAPAAPPASSGSDPVVSLPRIPSALKDGRPCTGASEVTTDRVPWSRRSLGLDRLWDLSQGQGITVAVVDTGVDADVRALAGRVTALGDAARDCVGHGTFAAGLVAAARTEGVGVAGLAPQVRLLAVRGTDERGTPSAERVAQGIRSAADQGAGVIYVGSALADGRQQLTEAVAHAASRDALVIAPAAPDTPPEQDGARPRPYWPAFAPRVLSVVDHGPGGTRPEDAVPVFSADLAAPGGLVVSTGPRGGHFIGSGPSFAAAHVAGSAALLRAYHPELSAVEVSRRLVAYGYPADIPLLDPYAALAAIDPAAPAGAPAVPPVKVTAPPSETPRNRSLTVAAAVSGLLVLVAGAAVVIPRGRARGWRPGGPDGAGRPQATT